MVHESVQPIIWSSCQYFHFSSLDYTFLFKVGSFKEDLFHERLAMLYKRKMVFNIYPEIGDMKIIVIWILAGRFIICEEIEKEGVLTNRLIYYNMGSKSVVRSIFIQYYYPKLQTHWTANGVNNNHHNHHSIHFLYLSMQHTEIQNTKLKQLLLAYSLISKEMTERFPFSTFSL